MIKFKRKECGAEEYSSCISITPCQSCGGKLEVWDIEEEENV